MANSVSPGFARLYYKNGGQEHRHDIPVYGDGAGGAITAGGQLKNKGGTAVAYQAALEAYANAYKFLLPGISEIERWEVYSVPTPTSIPLLVATGALGIFGGGASPDAEDTQATLTFKTSLGGLMRVVALDTHFGADRVVSVFNLGGTTGLDAIVTYMLSSASIRVGRDNAYSLTFKRMVTKQNDTLRKARLGI